MSARMAATARSTTTAAKISRAASAASTAAITTSTARFCIGVEGDYTWSDVSYERSENIFSVDVDYRGSLNYFASIRARLGWLYGSRTLFYATAGYSWSEIEVKVVGFGLGVCERQPRSRWSCPRWRRRVQILERLSARLEGLHYWGGNDEIGDEEAEINVIRAGISYYFK